jgi:hypothetical protein
MIDISQVIIDNIVVHHIGARVEGQPVRYSKNVLRLQDEEMVANVLIQYFFTPFKTEAYFNFSDPEEGISNVVGTLVRNVFDDPTIFYDASLQLAERLHELSNHPKIKGGEFYVALFRNCVVDGEVVDALGIFKSENKDTFLKVYLKDQNFELGAQEGINIRKLDKGCIIFNTEREYGYKAVMIDNVNRGNEAHFWKDDFLGLQPREDSYYFTQNYLNVCKGFVNDVYNGENKVPKPEQFDFLNRSIDFFDKKNSFSQEEFEKEVVRFPEVSEAFNDYRHQLVEAQGMPLTDSFDISKSAVKSEKKFFKSILKLDKNFHVYVHGRREYIEKGFDPQKGMNFYKLFYEQEV